MFLMFKVSDFPSCLQIHPYVGKNFIVSWGNIILNGFIWTQADKIKLSTGFLKL